MSQKQTILCGVTSHHPDCLCDVVVTQPATISSELRDGWEVRTVMECAEMSGPFHGKKLLAFLEVWLWAHDRVTVPQRRQANVTSFKSMSDPWRVWARVRFVEGASASAVRAEVLAEFGIELSASNAAHLRRRTLRRELALATVAGGGGLV